MILPIVGALNAHPMGNFSVNHYARFDFGAQHIELAYVLDLAEIPTLELLQRLKVSGASGPLLQQAVEGQAREWVKQLHVTENGGPVPVRLQRVTAHLMEGAGGLQILRVDIDAQISSRPGTLQYQDGNYAGRTGWKEIVIGAEKSVALSQSSQGSTDRSHALQIYPPNEIAAPPQDVRSTVTWSLQPFARPPIEVSKPLAGASLEPVVPSAIGGSLARPVPVPSNASAAASPLPSFTQQQPQPMGTVVRGDFLSRMLRKREIPFRLALIGVLFAFCLGAVHAFSPGHGKTIVAAYLVGTRGTLKHALFLGSLVTFTHTSSVFALGLGVLFFEQYVVPEQIIPILGAVSGLSIVGVGIMLMYRRTKALVEGGQPLPHHHAHGDGHSHPHIHEHVHSHSHIHDHSHEHSGHGRENPSLSSGPHVHEHSDRPDHMHVHQHSHDQSGLHAHSHGGKTHSHLPEGRISVGSLIALGVSGGLVPCPSALILLLGAIALGRTGLGLVLLVGFSAGLALVLMAIGAMVIYAKSMLPAGSGLRGHQVFRYVPVFSAVVVIVLGLMMTGISMGWITPRLAI